FLIDDFFQELEPLGRLDIMLQLSQRAVDYYKSLPEALRSPDTERNQALALLRHGASLQSQNRIKDGTPFLMDGLAQLERLYDAGDHSEATSMGLAYALRTRARMAVADSSPTDGLPYAQRAVELLRERAGAPDASRQLRLVYGQLLQFLGYTQTRAGAHKEAVVSARAAQAVALSLLEGDPKDERAQYLFVSVTPWLGESLTELGRVEEAKEAGRQGIARADALLRVRPGHRSALAARAVTNSYLAQIEGEQMRLAASMQLTRAAAADWIVITGNDPSNGSAWNNLSVAYFGLYLAQSEAGQMRESARSLAQARDAILKTPETVFTLANVRFWFLIEALTLADMGDMAGTQQALQNMRQKGQALLTRHNGPLRARVVACSESTAELSIRLLAGDTQASPQALQAALASMRTYELKNDNDWNRRIDCETFAGLALSEALLRQDRAAEAEKTAAAALAVFKPEYLSSFQRQRDAGDLRILLALGQARQGKLEAGLSALAPALKLHTELVAKSEESAYERFELARVLYVQALLEPAQRNALLTRSLALFNALPAEMRALRSVQLWQGWAQTAQRKGGA
ncbi:MAG TPA: hypothetical protein VGE47_00180, partial [Burkholderiaceae bacterium]